MPRSTKPASKPARKLKAPAKPLPPSSWQTAKVFKHGGSQAVRLPKAFRFETDEVLIMREDDHLVVREKPVSAAEILDEIMGSSPNFMKDRKQPPIQKRQWWWE
jgi:antitoxin VapB